MKRMNEEADPFLQKAISDLRDRLEKIDQYHKAAVHVATARKLEGSEEQEAPSSAVDPASPTLRRWLQKGFGRASTWLLRKAVSRIVPLARPVTEEKSQSWPGPVEDHPFEIVDMELASPGAGGPRDDRPLYIVAVPEDGEGE